MRTTHRVRTPPQRGGTLDETVKEHEPLVRSRLAFIDGLIEWRLGRPTAGRRATQRSRASVTLCLCGDHLQDCSVRAKIAVTLEYHELPVPRTRAAVSA